MAEPTVALSSASTKRCTKCGDLKPLSEFHNSKRTADRKRPQCKECTRPVRQCLGCGRTFRASNFYCLACSGTDRQCADCGRGFRGTTRCCARCQAKVRECAGCGKEITSTQRFCLRCYARERECTACGRRYTGVKPRCWPCLTTDRICVGCRLPFRGHQLYCVPCQAKDRECAECGRRYRGHSRVCRTCKWLALSLEERQEFARKIHARRRQLIEEAEVDGPVPKAVYRAVLQSGPCSYCGNEAKTVDHIRPLTRGGIEHESNLTPACKSCNNHKAARLLTEWHIDLVLHAVSACPKVAAEWARQNQEAA